MKRRRELVWLLVLLLAGPAPGQPEQAAGWRWAASGACQDHGERLVVDLPDDSAAAFDTFRACGVVAGKQVLINSTIAELLRAAQDDVLAPLLTNRAKLREVLRSAMRARKNLRVLWQTNETVQRNAYLRAGRFCRERDDGRLDVQLLPGRQVPPEVQRAFDAFNRTELLASPSLVPLLHRLLGADAELKSVHLVTALPSGATAREAQHWHRDTGLLFADDVHARDGGVHLPPYALNLFVPLVDLDATNGPTEFTLGSHQWGSVWADDEEAEAPLQDRTFHVPAGSFILFDYRTVHRGTVNRSHRARPMLMLVYGRSWWTDRVNYGFADFGGFPAAPAPAVPPLLRAVHLAAAEPRPLVARHSPSEQCPGLDEAEDPPLHLRERMFWGLTNLWEEGLWRELQAEAQAARWQRGQPPSTAVRTAAARRRGTGLGEGAT